MSKKQNSSPKLKRVGKNKRVVANPVVRNRRGGGKPQPREITSPWRILDMRLAMRRHMMTYLGVRNVDIPSGSPREEYFKGLIGILEDMTFFELLLKQMKADAPETFAVINEAFVYAYGKIQDADLIALPGRYMVFYESTRIQMEKERKQEEWELRQSQQKQKTQQKPHPKQQHKPRHPKVQPKPQPQLTSNVANRIAQARTKVSA